MHTNYACYVLIAIVLSISILGSSLCISASDLSLSSPSLYIPHNNATKPISISTRNQTIAEDKFGITKLYPIKLDGEEWYMNMNNPTSDPRFNLNNQYKHVGKSSVSKFNFTKNPDGSWKVISPKVRMEVYTSTGYNQSKITTYNQSKLADKGYMQSPNDWKNVEITGYVKYNGGKKSNENFDWYARGGIHTDSNNGCEGTAYKGNLYYSGNSDFGKEQWHENGFVSTDTKINVTSLLKGKWIGFKFVIYNLPPIKNGTMSVKLENWINENADGKTWKKVDDKIDNGGWGKDGGRCGGRPDQIITWGGPIVTFRWDGANDVDIRNFSVREIVYPSVTTNYWLNKIIKDMWNPQELFSDSALEGSLAKLTDPS
jgi:hypothetical protein